MSQGVEVALANDVSVVIITQMSRDEMCEYYVRVIFDKSLTAWRAPNKAVEKDSWVSAMVMIAKPLFGAWLLLQCMAESDDSPTAREA